MTQDDPWAVPYTDLDALRARANAGRRRIWPWAVLVAVLSLSLVAGGGVFLWFAKGSLQDLKANGKIGQRIYLRAHAYAEQAASAEAEPAEVEYTVVHHLANTAKPQMISFGQAVSLPWEPPARGAVLDLEGSLVEVTLTVRARRKGSRNLVGPTCSLSLDGDLLDNRAAAGYSDEVACHWKFSK